MHEGPDMERLRRVQTPRRENAGAREVLLALARTRSVCRRLARREVLMAAVATMLAGCAQAITRWPFVKQPFALGRTGTLYPDGTVPPVLGRAIIQHLRGVAGIPGVTAASSHTPAPDFILTFGKLPPGYTGAAIGASPLTIITHLRVPVDNITADQARALLSGMIPDWKKLGTPYSLPVHLLALRGLSLPAGVPVARNVR
ncbi:MAG: hypothetical protein J2P36_16760, partial [Ktedonobacteraceae bacterium]|nr:hypothetical protein [Ktedonobacteraceae bacterium]